MAVTINGNGTITGVTTLPDGIVTNDDLAGSIAISKLATTGTGSSANFLRGDGAYAAAGGGAWNVITSTNVSSAVASVDFTTGIDATYRTYIVQWEGAVSNTNIDGLYSVLGDSSGFDTGSADYKYTATYTYNASVGSAQGSSSSGKIYFAGMYSGTVSGSSVFGQATFTRPIDSASFPSVYWTGGCCSHSSEARETTGVGVRTAAITVDRIRFAFVTGTIIRGRFTLYGISHA